MASNDKSVANDPEAEFLVEQAKLARRAIGNVLGDIGRDLLRSADIRAWAVRYPLPTVATAAAAGVGAGVAVRSALHRGNKPANGETKTHSAESQASDTHETNSPSESATPPGLVASTLRSLATGLAGAAAEALVAATRERLQATLAPQREVEAKSEPST